MGVKKLNGNLNLILLSLLVLAHACGKRENQAEVFQKGGFVCAILAHPDDISGHWDHIATGVATDSAFGQTGTGKWLLHMAITKPRSPFYANGVPVPKNELDVILDVSGYFNEKKQAVDAHKTQFNPRTRSAYKLYVHTMRKEKFIIAAYPEK